MNYIELVFQLNPVLPAREVLMAELAEKGFESFVEQENGLTAYIQEKEFTAGLLEDLMTFAIPELVHSMERKLIQDRNWNAEWEKNFEPIIVDDQCLIRAPFHTNLPDYTFVIDIEPKMSFGTGHHATTHLMISAMLKMAFDGKKVLDMGCGTGVLAILAEKKGAASLDAIDIDDWAFENTLENIQRNASHHISVLKGGAETIPAEAEYDVVLANINRNILTRDMNVYVKHMKLGSEILFSGFYATDIHEITSVAEENKLTLMSQASKGEWCMLHFRK
jgi:ribosomal protein L11 methyltransferase